MNIDCYAVLERILIRLTPAWDIDWAWLITQNTASTVSTAHCMAHCVVYNPLITGG